MKTDFSLVAESISICQNPDLISMTDMHAAVYREHGG